jgi:TRAP-type C4-dicarboxylate transport system substrate-binding protein
MRRRLLPLAVAAGLAAALHPSPLGAATLLKMATLSPDGSVWHQILKGMETEVAQATQGRVTIRLYANGVAGDDPDMVRKMRLGQLHAAALTVAGLNEIDDGFKVFGMPLFFADYEELYHVLDALRPEMARRLEARGFVLLGWGQAGWVHLFSTKPVATIDDLKRLKLFQWAGDDSMVQWWKSQGFRPVSLAATDVMTGLQTGMVEVLPTTPLAALSFQYFRQTPHMLELGLAPLVGGTVVTRKAWNTVSEADRQHLLAAAQKAEKRFAQEIPKQDAAAVAEMRKRGLQVTPAAGAAAEEWRRGAATLATTLRGGIVPAAVYDLAIAARDAYRRQAGKQP